MPKPVDGRLVSNAWVTRILLDIEQGPQRTVNSVKAYVSLELQDKDGATLTQKESEIVLHEGPEMLNLKEIRDRIAEKILLPILQEKEEVTGLDLSHLKEGVK